MLKQTKWLSTLSVLLLSSLLWQVGHTKTVPSRPHSDTVSSTALPNAITPPKRLLVVVPHPDDESLTATSMIYQTLAHNGRVHIAVMTNGDGFRKAASLQYHVQHPKAADLYQLGLHRQQELLTAIHRLGMSAADVTFLGFPDAGMHQLWGHHWNVDSPYRSVNGHHHVPYDLSYHKDLPYCGQAVVGTLHNLIRDYQPTDILYPDPHDVHRDHWATSAFIQYALSGTAKQPHEWTFLVHYPDFPVPRTYRPGQPLLPPDNLTRVGMTWYRLPLHPAQIEQKHQAILAHSSQVNVMEKLLESFVRTNELIASSHVPTIPRVVSPRSFQSIRALPYTVLADPENDQQTNSLKATDIKRLAAVWHGNHLTLCLEFADRISPEFDYTFRLRLPGKSIYHSQLDLRIHQGQIIGVPSVNLGRIHSEKPQITFWKNRLIVSLPDTALHNAQSLLLSAEISKGNVLLDKTVWRRFQIQQKNHF